MTDTGSSRRRGKVERLIDSEDLPGLGAELEARWRGDGREREGLRDLADRFNRELLRARMEVNGIEATEDEVATIYRVLTGDGVDSGSRTQLRRRLEHEGVDPDELASDFVSRQAVHTYLTEVREAEHSSRSVDPVDRDSRTIRRLLSRTEAVTEDKLQTLHAADHVDIGEFRVTASVRVFCLDCGVRLDANELLREGGCEC